MRKNRRMLQVTTSDDEDDGDPQPPSSNRAGRSSSRSSGEGHVHDGGGGKRRKTVRMPDYDDDDEEEDGFGDRDRDRDRDRDGEGGENRLKRRKEEKEEEEEEEEEEEDKEEEEDEEAKPIGEPIRVSAKGRWKRSHYVSFELDGNQFELEDPVLLVPEEKNQKPYVAIIKDISQTKTGGLMVTGQWFYRPEEAEKKGGGNWQSQDTRELFYSFHRDEVPAESVMHKCVVHFIPRHKQLPRRKEHPGFIVQKVYDTVEKKLWQLTDKDYEDTKQHEIDLLVQKTMAQLGDVPDLETEEGNTITASEQQDQLKGKKSLKKRNISPLDVVRREEDLMSRSDHNLKAETPGSCVNTEYTAIVAKFDEGTGDSHRDKWLERLLQAVEYIFNTERAKDETDNKTSESEQLSEEKKSKGEKTLVWPDSAVSPVVALEKASHETFATDFQKYNQKMRQLSFNLKNNAVLARRFVNGELDAVKILNMSPTELKEGLTAEETGRNEPEESASMQMTDARCSRCSEFKVGVRDIIQAGHGDRYQLECLACGHSWYASRDAISMLTIDGPNSTKSVGTAPWATTKFENVEKQLSSPCDGTKSAEDVLKKSTEAYMPVLERQKSLGKPRVEETAESTQ